MTEPWVRVFPRSLRVAVTGHRESALAGADRRLLKERIDEVLDGISAAAEECGRDRPLVLSALAEGADRWVAERALAAGLPLGVLLPFPPAVYETDFGSEGSRHAFRTLLARAAHVEVVPSTRPAAEGTDNAKVSRDVAYVDLGKRLALEAEVMIALWDGEPARGGGGTAEVVAEATSRGVPTVWIESKKPHDVRAFSATHPPVVVPPPVTVGVRSVVSSVLVARAAAEARPSTPFEND